MPLIEKPEIHFFRASTDKAMADEEVELTWEISNARKIKLDGIEQEAKGSYKARINTVRAFELTASNWTNRESANITIQLYTPVVLLFETDSSSVSEDQPVSIHFQVKYALSWQLIAEYTSLATDAKTIIAEGQIANGYQVYDHSIQVLLKGSCTLRLITRNGHETGTVERIRLSTKPPYIQLYKDKEIVITGSLLQLSWKVENARKVVLNPGNINVTELSRYDLLVTQQEDFMVEVTATGDFHSQHADVMPVRLARINHFGATNNADIANPEYYLTWSATGLPHMKLLPDNVFVRESENRYWIPASTTPVTYTLSGQTVSGEEITKTITLLPATIQEPVLEKGVVIIGRMATLSWKAAHARRIQIEFSDIISPLEIPLNESKHHFQVFENRDKVRLIVWGDTNLLQAEVHIPRFKGPEIKLFQLPSISLQLNVTWMRSPLVGSAQKAHDAFSMMQKTTQRTAGLTQLFCVLLSSPSGLMLKRIAKHYAGLQKNENNIRYPLIIIKHGTVLLSDIFKKLKQPLVKTVNHE